MLFLEVTTMKKSGVYVHMYKSVHMQMMCMEKKLQWKEEEVFLEVVPPVRTIILPMQSMPFQPEIQQPSSR